jgi:hypothetical protein
VIYHYSRKVALTWCYAKYPDTVAVHH